MSSSVLHNHASKGEHMAEKSNRGVANGAPPHMQSYHPIKQAPPLMNGMSPVNASSNPHPIIQNFNPHPTSQNYNPHLTNQNFNPYPTSQNFNPNPPSQNFNPHPISNPSFQPSPTTSTQPPAFQPSRFPPPPNQNSFPPRPQMPPHSNIPPTYSATQVPSGAPLSGGFKMTPPSSGLANPASSGPLHSSGFIGPPHNSGPTGAASSGTFKMTPPPSGLANPAPSGLLQSSGPVGPQHSSGPTGPTGPLHSSGPTGPTGPLHSYGPAGPLHSSGPTGPLHNYGPAGPLHSSGPTGPQHSSGPIGPLQSSGPAGPLQSSGPTGSGPAGPPSNFFPNRQPSPGLGHNIRPPPVSGPPGYSQNAAPPSMYLANAGPPRPNLLQPPMGAVASQGMVGLGPSQNFQSFQPPPTFPPPPTGNMYHQNQSLPLPAKPPTPLSHTHGTPQMTGPPPINSQPPAFPPGSQHPPPLSSQRYPGVGNITQGMANASITQQGFNKLWGMEAVDLLQCRNVLPPQKVEPPAIKLGQEFFNSGNCAPDIFCCTLTKIPETNNLLQKSRLPLGIVIHPFKDLNQLAVIQCSSIVRCRVCRTYINPFVYFVDNKRWKCNLCFRVNELPEEFRYDPVTKTCGDPSRRPEIKSATIEYIAPSEYMLRPPQPAIYLFVLDVSRNACDSGYLATFCSTLLEELESLPGDSRAQIGFILFDSCVHFYSMAENLSQPHELVVTDIEDVFLPTPDSLLVNLKENQHLIRNLLEDLPVRYAESFDTDSALGPALQAAYKLMSTTGGRVTVFQSCLPNKGPGSLTPREDPNQRSSKDVHHLGPQTDFYKRLSLDCSSQQIAVDMFLVNSQYVDLATIGGISQFTGGCIYHFPMFRRSNVETNERLVRSLKRYLTRKIGFEAVMRVRCSRGLSIHTFHGNFFVRSTDLLSLPNVNPDAGFAMQVSIEESLSELQTVCFQAAVLYTSAKGERRIRVHTMCLPVSSNLFDILNAADQQAIIGLLSKMAVDRSLKASISDAREAFINAAIDILSAYRLVETSGGPNSILAPINLALIPTYILALLKSTAFRTGSSTRLDDRVFAMVQLKTLPLRELIQLIHPDLYNVTQLSDDPNVLYDDRPVAQPARLSLSSEHLDSRGVYIVDTPDVIYLVIGRSAPAAVVNSYLDNVDQRHLAELVDLPELENVESERLRHFVSYLQSEKSVSAIVKILTEPKLVSHYLINDKTESTLSYYELLHHVKAQMK